MTDSEKFAGFKQKIIDDNEKKYGEEIRAELAADKQLCLRVFPIMHQ